MALTVSWHHDLKNAACARRPTEPEKCIYSINHLNHLNAALFTSDARSVHVDLTSLC